MKNSFKCAANNLKMRNVDSKFKSSFGRNFTIQARALRRDTRHNIKELRMKGYKI